MKKGSKSRKEILAKALKLFIRKGYKSTSMDELCQATGFTKGALYHHFKDKKDLYRQSLSDFFAFQGPPRWTEDPELSLKERIRKGFHAVDKSKAFIQKAVGSKKDDAILSFYSFLYSATREFPEYQTQLDEYDDCKHSSLAKAFREAIVKGEIRDDVDPWVLAVELDALLQQLVYLRFVNHRVREQETLLDELFENYWKRLESAKTKAIFASESPSPSAVKW